jgi:predicted RNA-binding protein with PIN domain
VHWGNFNKFANFVKFVKMARVQRVKELSEFKKFFRRVIVVIFIATKLPGNIRCRSRGVTHEVRAPLLFANKS